MLPSTSSPSLSIPQSPSSRRRILSQIVSPFTSKSRSITDFYIQCDDPHKQYSPGDVVTGSVNLRVLRPTRITHIVVCLHGYVQVYKTPNSPVDFRSSSGYLSAGRGSKSGKYFGNGFARLFEDEVVLCGDGRLAEGSYQFKFELEFPDSDLPSSIDFERGTISYMITSTMTRPVTIRPTLSCDRMVYFVERIDIADFQPPKPRTIKLEPLSKRSRAKIQARKLVEQAERKDRKPGLLTVDGPHDSRHSSALGIQDGSNSPESPAPSDISFDSSLSSSGGHPPILGSNLQSPIASEDGRLEPNRSSLSNKTINVTVEMTQGGYLRGDNIPIKIIISHVKHIKSIYGVIITLQRSARVDFHPAIPLGPTEKGLKQKYEDHYPKSFTGLGGLSLSGVGSSHVFRKDLSQTILPLIVDPDTLTAEISAKVRVPDEAFPSISTVPGGMISFKYQVEVILDIQGKFAGQERHLGNVGAVVSAPVFFGGIPNDGGLDGSGSSVFAAYGSNMVDTVALRREKSVVTCLFETVIGTRDSSRRKGKERVEVPSERESGTQQPQAAGDAQLSAYIGADLGWNQDLRRDPDYAYHQHGGGPEHLYEEQTYEYMPPEVPMPQLQNVEELPEKERMRQAEARLLPSEPPGMFDEVSTESAQLPSAPFIPEESHAEPIYIASAPLAPDDGDALSSSWPSAPKYEIVAGAPYVVAGNGTGAATEEAEPATSFRALVYEHASPSVEHPKDDNQDLQRQRRVAEASAPPREPYDGTGTSTPLQEDEPTAPGTFSETDDTEADHKVGPSLPRYQR